MTIQKGNFRLGQSGFTLIELMIAILVVGILAGVAYPSFMDTVRKSNRNDARASLTRAVAAQERFFATNGTYTTDIEDLGFNADGDSEHEHYTITATAGSTGIASSYTMTATAVTGDIQADDDGCTVMTINSLGRRTPDPNLPSNCW